MGFRGIYKAVYDYKPQGEGELDIKEGDILYVLEKSTEDDWWKAKKKATDDDDDEPTGLIPCNYIEEVSRPAHASEKEGHGKGQIGGSTRVTNLLYQQISRSWLMSSSGQASAACESSLRLYPPDR